MTRLDINGAFINQRVTGQQRYAREISRALTQLQSEMNIDLHVIMIRPSRFKVIEWLQSLLICFHQRSRAWLLTLTSRGPLIAKRHVLVVHDLFLLTHPEWYSRVFAISHACFLRIQLRTASLIICVSEPVAAEVRQRIRDRVPVIVAPNAPSAVFLNPPDNSSIFSALGIQRKSYILCVASRDPRKNVNRLLEAHQLMPSALRANYPLVLVGGASSSFQTVRYTSDAYIVDAGYIPDEDLAILYKEAALVGFPSLAEGFGLPAVEALASGAPLLVHDNDVMRWVCGEHAIYVDCTNLQLLSQVMICALTSDLAQSFDNSPEWVTSRYNWKSSAKSIIEGIQSMSYSK